MTGVCVGLKPQNIEDITAIIALYRPGPMDSIPGSSPASTTQQDQYLQAPVPGAHPVRHLRLHRLPGAGDPDLPAAGGLLPGAGGHGAPGHLQKKAAQIEKEREAFLHGDPERNIAGCVANGIPEETAQAIYHEIYDFANYAFNKAHAVSYAVVAYQTAWFKCHYPREYMAALLTSVLDNPRGGGGGHQRVPGLRHRPAAAGHQPLRRPLYRGGGGHPLRPGGHQEHRPGLHPGR